MTLRDNTVENIVGKGKNTVNRHFIFSLNIFNSSIRIFHHFIRNNSLETSLNWDIKLCSYQYHFIVISAGRHRQNPGRIADYDPDERMAGGGNSGTPYSNRNSAGARQVYDSSVGKG